MHSILEVRTGNGNAFSVLIAHRGARFLIHLLESQRNIHIVEGESWGEPSRQRFRLSILAGHDEAILHQIRLLARDLPMIPQEDISVRERKQPSSYRHHQVLSGLHSSDELEVILQRRDMHREVVHEYFRFGHPTVLSRVPESVLHPGAIDPKSAPVLHEIQPTLCFLEVEMTMKWTQSRGQLLLSFAELDRPHSHIDKLLRRSALTHLVIVDTSLKLEAFIEHLRHCNKTCSAHLLYLDLAMAGLVLTTCPSSLFR